MARWYEQINWTGLTEDARREIQTILERDGSYTNEAQEAGEYQSGCPPVVALSELARHLAATSFRCDDLEQGVLHELQGEGLGYASSEDDGDVFLDGLFTPESVQVVRDGMDGLMQGSGGVLWGHEVAVMSKNGELVRQKCVLMREETSGGGVTIQGMLLGVGVQDRQEHVQRALLSNQPYAMCVCDAAGNMVEWNAHFEELSISSGGARLEVGQCIVNNLGGELEWAMREGVKLSSQGMQFERLSFMESDERWLEVQAFPIKDEFDQVFSILVILTDLTPRIEEERVLTRLSQRLELEREAVGQLPLAVVITDRHWQIREWIANTAQDLGIKSDNIQDIRSYFISHDDSEWSKLEGREGYYLTTKEEWDGVCVAVGGTEIPVHVRVKSVVLPGIGEQRASQESEFGWVIVIEDIRKQRELEEELRQAQKVEALGMLTGGMTHDLNNLLTVILGHLELAEMELPSGHTVRMDLDGIRAAVERASALTVKLLAFARAQITELQVLDVLEVVMQIKPLLLRTLSEDMRLLLRLDPRSHLIRVDVVQLEQLLINLVVNARDALTGARGEIVITTESRRIRMERKAIGGERIPPGEYVVLSVIDNGEGILPENLERIFDPFFTTKAEGHGTGLGLSTCIRIVKQNNGYMRCESKVGVGTVFEVWLPLVESVHYVDMSMISSHEIMQATSGTTVLLVEDDRALRTTLKRSLESYGYSVYDARHGKAALDILKRMAKLPDLIVTDVAMPDMGGVALFHELDRMGLSIPVLFMSGYSDELCAVQQIQNGQQFVSKPFTPKHLLLHVQNCLYPDGL